MSDRRLPDLVVRMEIDNDGQNLPIMTIDAGLRSLLSTREYSRKQEVRNLSHRD